MRHALLPLLCAALALLLAVGCRSSRTASTADTPAHKPAAPRYTVVTFTGTVEGISVSGQVRLAPDSLIWGSATKLLEVGRAMASPDSVWVRSSLLGIHEATDYAHLRHATGLDISFGWLQQTLLDADPAPRIEALAASLGYSVSLRIVRREQVDRLSFPW